MLRVPVLFDYALPFGAFELVEEFVDFSSQNQDFSKLRVFEEHRVSLIDLEVLELGDEG
jgi:hypothetical protein